MRYYLVAEIRKLLARWQFAGLLLLALVLTGVYITDFLGSIVQLYAMVHRNKPEMPFGLFFYETLSSRIHLILVISCALVSTLVWELETSATLQRALKLTPGNVAFFMGAKVLLCLLVLAVQLGFMWMVITVGIAPLNSLLQGKYLFSKPTLAHFLAIQYMWLLPVLLLNVCWFIWLGERAVVVFFVALVGVFLLGFISFMPFYAFLSHRYGQSTPQISELVWLLGWTVGLYLFLRRQLINYV